jgi:hypothetical protein
MKYIFTIIIKLLYAIIFIYHEVTSIEEPGMTNPKYKIKDYFGSRYLSSFLSSTFLIDEPTIVSWSTGQYIHKKSSDKLFISNFNKNTIDLIEGKNLHILVGELYEPGFRNGDAENARFNTPRALVLYNESSFPNKNELKYKPVLFNENSASTSPCIYATISNYSSCLNHSYNLERLSADGDPTDINPNLVKLLNINQNVINEDNQNNDEEVIYLFVADSKNHCIRKIDLVNAEVTTFAGECTEKGFKDGPLGVNRFSEPQGIGIDSYGNIYVYDAGNKYMRYISPDGYVHTLIQGACFEYKLGINVENEFNYITQNLLCFRKWIKRSGEPTEHIYYSNNEEYCYDNIVNCPNYLSEQKRKN